MRSRRGSEVQPSRRSVQAPARPGGLPSSAALLEYLRDNPEAQSPREIARAFRLRPSLMPALRGKLRAIEHSGELARSGDRKFVPGAPLPEIMPVERCGTDADGLPLARPVNWQGPGEPPLFRLIGAAGEELGPGTAGPPG